MRQETQVFTYGDLQMEFAVFGRGDETIIAFHGFGEDLNNFSNLHDLIKPGQRLISCHLFQHGKSSFPEVRLPNSPLSVEEFGLFIDAFCKEMKIEHFHLLGYSLGAKICLCLFQQRFSRVDDVLLLAPDGFKVNALYSFTSRTKFGRWLYRQVLHHPTWFFKLADVLYYLQVIDKKLHRFVHYHMASFEQRKLVYDTWLIYRDFVPEKSTLAKLIESSSQPFHAIFGRYDRIIRPEIGSKFFNRGLEEHMHLVEAGHLLINKETNRVIRELKLWPGDGE